MKKAIFFAAVICACFSNNLKAQSVNVQKAGVILTKDDPSGQYFLENTTSDSIKVAVVNHQEQVEDLGGGNFAVNNGEHEQVAFTVPPKTKVGLAYKICIHSTGLAIGSADSPALLEYKFYTAKN